jgi:hypothetical protein
MEVLRMTPSNNDGSDPPFDLDRLHPEERDLWEKKFATSIAEDGEVVRVWSFGYICMLELWGVPEVVGEWLQEHDPENTVRQYLDNVRRARREGRL